MTHTIVKYSRASTMPRLALPPRYKYRYRGLGYRARRVITLYFSNYLSSLPCFLFREHGRHGR